MDLHDHLDRQITFSLKTFGPGTRTHGLLDHMRKELKEIEATPFDLEEWVDMILLSLDGAWRHGHTPGEICCAIEAKLHKNENRDWPDWKTAPENQAIEHIRNVQI